ncbi:N-acetylmuramic acid 6-phosphate etherase [Putridiphycobacter roseus]|uniref:N-acetylmuramic acid 6-phosphate etherase n=1 Tax=Putridiphycobacter roseus TaxID=2219161 RepID=A0A2W1NQ41_9FLAO|nr:N-acetylmuramic acid 6-phosphate etherase [Putridiphycobacter roseus]PZE16758.1 N-acetylmuramic acid 6-phosphate etherase [Putridiphycobacter roseus]
MDKRTTEQSSNYDNLEKMSTTELLKAMNAEDKTVPLAIEKCLPAIHLLIDAVLPKMKTGGRLFYIGAGTSGRLGIVDASECPPTFGVDHGLVIGLIAGGDQAIRKAVEFAEDDSLQGQKDLETHQFNANDTLIGIAASGSTPYVIGAVNYANSIGAITGCITNNRDSELAKVAQFPIAAIVGPEFVTGSTRMKSGTSQKLILNMISTTLMIQLGKVKGNKMVDMQLSNDKLVDRGTKMVMNALNIKYEAAKALLLKHKSVRAAIEKA